MLEQQQTQLVSGLRELYKLAIGHDVWPGAPLKELPTGHPLTHDMLDRLGALKQDNNIGDEFFEDDLDAAQQRLIAKGADLQRRDSSDASSTGAISPASTSNRLSAGDLFSSDTFLPTPPEFSHLSHSRSARSGASARPSTAQMQPQDSQRPQQQRQQPNPQEQSTLTSSLDQPHFHFPTQAVVKPEINTSTFSNYTWPQLGSDEMDMGLDNLRSFDAIENVDYLQMATAQLPRIPNEANACLPHQPDWNDEDFNIFFNANPQTGR